MAKTHLAHHELAVNAHLGALQLDLQADFTAAWTILFGPSGSGKSSTLRAMCGLPLGKSRRNDRIVFERHNPDGSWVDLNALPTHRRDLAYAPQNPALFPHLTVRGNVSFPYNACSTPVEDADLIDNALTLFSLHALTGRYPRDLSGGERQRVSLARAFATPGARLLLLDEPFTGLDRPTRDDLLPRMKEFLTQRNLPVISVTHDIDEALQLQAEVLRIDAGRCTAQGPANAVLAEERLSLLRSLDPATSPTPR